MRRREALTALPLLIGIAGCSSSPSNQTSTPRNTSTETATPSPEGATPECSPSMCEGTALVEVVVTHGFSGDVILRAECRDEEFPVQSGESVQIDREEDAGTCGISVSINGEQVFSETIEGYESVTLTINSNGEVEEEWIVR